ncbi:MAG: hypothetical protein GY928_28265 [Colwellia sp.]|nr:hypothetical protein [Colwellia sp.]
MVAGNDNPFSSVSIPAIIGSGVGAGGAAVLGAGVIAPAFYSRTLGILAQGTFEGVIGGAAGLAAQSFENTTVRGGCSGR